MARSPRQLALDIAYGHRGKIYTWGGDDPEGFDCSGLINDVLKAPGKVGRGERLTAQGFFDRYKGRLLHPAGIPRPTLVPGMLVFWERKRTDGTKYIGHIEMVFEVLSDGTVVTIGASGGGSKTLTVADAIRDNAFVQIRPIAPGWVAAVDPFDP